MALKQYLISLKKQIIIFCLLFVFFVFVGFFSAQSSPKEAELLLEKIMEIVEPLAEMPAFGQFLFILLNNSLILFLVVVFGLVFGIFPFLVLFSNATLIGLVAFLAKTAFSWPVFFLATLPHGVIEVPALILACAAGYNLGQKVFERIFKKQGNIKSELNLALIFFLKVILPFLVLAALIEVFITSKLI
ncbi:MAG: hypothetical protein FJZ05_01385 [Candidatus Nealsonbacteria bacterium]|nr:hypothetical protein [Candidatus Nealsonbacteria bacterium]